MDTLGTGNAHKWVGVPSHRSDSKNLPQGPSWSFSITVAGEFHSSSLHKHLGCGRSSLDNYQWNFPSQKCMSTFMIHLYKLDWHLYTCIVHFDNTLLLCLTMFAHVQPPTLMYSLYTNNVHSCSPPFLKHCYKSFIDNMYAEEESKELGLKFTRSWEFEQAGTQITDFC